MYDYWAGMVNNEHFLRWFTFWVKNCVFTLMWFRNTASTAKKKHKIWFILMLQLAYTMLLWLFRIKIGI